MNLAIRGIENNLGSKNADTFHEDLHKNLKADFILANPPFNQSDWGQPLLLDDARWKWGTPPAGNANYGWIEHMLDKLSQKGKAGVVLANGSLSSNTSNEGEIIRELSDEDIKKIANTYISWQNEENYEDIQGFCKVASIDEIREHDFILTPGRYVGIEEVEDDGEPFEEKMERLTSTLSMQFEKSRELEDEIRKQLGGIGYEL